MLQKLRAGVEILIATPGRLMDLFQQRAIRLDAVEILVLDEADRSIHDALCVVRSLVKKRFMIAGGGSPEAECALRLTEWAKTLTGVRSYCVRAFAEVPYSNI